MQSDLALAVIARPRSASLQRLCALDAVLSCLTRAGSWRREALWDRPPGTPRFQFHAQLIEAGKGRAEREMTTGEGRAERTPLVLLATRLHREDIGESTQKHACPRQELSERTRWPRKVTSRRRRS